MSILSSQPLAVQESLPISWILIVLAAVSLAAAIVVGLLSLRRLPGPPRLAPDRSALPLAGVLIGAMGFYLFAATATVSAWDALAPKYGATSQPADSPAGIALLSAIPPLVALVALLIGDHIIRPNVHQNLGLDSRLFPRGFLYGLGGAILVLPSLYLASQAMELIYHRVNYSHPNEHPLLHVLGAGPTGWIKSLIILGACLIAPLCEELVFRAHLQTLILRALNFLVAALRQFGNRQSTVGNAADLQSDNPHSAIPNPKSPSSPWTTWAAILITSFLFASVHPLWSLPIIFLLALALGYAYERTANLWIPITMHAAFNTVSTLLFLLGAASH